MAPPQIAILGAGIFVKTEYIPRLSEIADLFVLKAIWSRTEESARGAVDIAEKSFPEVECKWGDAGLNEIIEDASIVAVLVVLAAQFQAFSFLSISVCVCVVSGCCYVRLSSDNAPEYFIGLDYGSEGKSINEVKTALSSYNSLSTSLPRQPIWAIAENYRFEPAFLEGKTLMPDIGDLVNFQILVEAPMNSSNPYFSSSWRHNFTGGYILDMAVHFVAVLRMLAGCEVTSVSAMTSHVDTTLPPPDSMSSIIQLENGRSGVLVAVLSGKTFKLVHRFVGAKGTLQIDVENREGKFGFSVTLFTADGQTKTSYYPFRGVTEELKTFFNDVSLATEKKDLTFRAEPRLSVMKGPRCCCHRSNS
ncbi:hypothetical protein Sango_0404200 [Sesamum angolense]|uniref:GFO/IDH/MocA-like oxidoreductase domain-containing protein n=1 Tax=Sesamum angolense TaxID=2727404 RepID=A0AAE1XAA3_9LAMI|nr:hypothetical protein Sango_0404200 [Sesamum angolense]